MGAAFEETDTTPRASPSSHNDHNATLIPQEPQLSFWVIVVHLPSDSTAHSGLDHPIIVINDENILPKINLMWVILQLKFLFQPDSSVVKLTKTNQHPHGKHIM